MKKNKLIMLMALPFMMSLVGCGDGDASVSKSPSEPSVTKPSTVEPTLPSTETPSENSSVEQSTPSVEQSTPSVNPSTPSVNPSIPDPSVEPSVPTPDLSTSVDPDVPPVDPNYAGNFELVSATSGDERIHIEGAGVWIWVKSSSIGYAEGTNAIEDFDLEVTMTKGNLSINESSLTLFGNIRDRVRVYVTLDGAPGTRDETAFYVKITAPNGKYFDNTVEFIGKNWTEAELPDKIDGGSFELYTEGTGNDVNRIEGAGAWIWIKSSSVGYDGTNWSEIDVTNVQIDNDNFIVDNYFTSDPDTVRFRVYVLLDKGPVDSDSITFTIRVENATHYFVGTVSFSGTTLVD